MYQILKHSHSGLRWLVLLFLIWAIISAYRTWRSGKETMSPGRSWLFGMTFVHLQFLLGAVLYFMSPYVQFNELTMSDSIIRFYTVEHLVGMLLSVILITMGYTKAKKKIGTTRPGRIVFWYYLIALVIILVSIPWPFRNLAGNWY